MSIALWELTEGISYLHTLQKVFMNQIRDNNCVYWILLFIIKIIFFLLEKIQFVCATAGVRKNTVVC